MAGTYSVRFIQVAGANAAGTYVVPPGKRAVVKGVTAYLASGASAALALAVNNVNVWAAPLPAAGQGLYTEVRLVAYSGEPIALASSGADVRAHVSGFLFDDPAGGQRDPTQLPEHPAPTS